MVNATALASGQKAYEKQDWGTAYERLVAADNGAPLEPADLECLGMAAYLTGRYEEQTEVLERAHHAYLSMGDEECAARCAFLLGFSLMGSGEPARGGGWISRAQRLLDTAAIDCAVRGFLLLLDAHQTLESGDNEAAYAAFGEAAEIGDRFEDTDLTTLARLGRGMTLNRMGDTPAGVALMDEAMVAVTTDEVSPFVVGSAYCSVIEECHQIFDLRRAQEWTAALSQWCSSHPDLVPYRGQCLVRRAEIMQLHGAWTDALQEAQRAQALLDEGVSRTAVGGAYYRQAEVHRLRGDFVQAEDAYRLASDCGRDPHPGLAQLRLRQGNGDAAVAAIRLGFMRRNEWIFLRALPLSVGAGGALGTFRVSMYGTLVGIEAPPHW